MPKGNGDMPSLQLHCPGPQASQEHGECRKAMETLPCHHGCAWPIDHVRNTVNAERQWRQGQCDGLLKRLFVRNTVNAERQWRQEQPWNNTTNPYYRQEHGECRKAMETYSRPG